ncbi:septin-interacting protein 1-like [Ctenocephalides felis]|uniref:septin-interacting protein 1-like n=1 Tax=Ctenocephalides felis TaxID=7515 RepID=UPI000E6E4C8A|nr:septin-interacting protein 1-like [Ctenocephalides felis]
MDEDEVERFEITDYDLENEFYPRSRRRPTKNQQIYGIWAADDSEDDEPKSGRKRPKDYSAPVNFIAGGIQQSGKKEKVEDEEKEEEPEVINSSSESDEEPRASFKSNETAGMRSVQKGFVQQGVGSWEKHTKGIGAKLLLQMGYQPGKGLGKTLQGISAPVQAHVRKGRGAIGAYGPEKAPKVADKKSGQATEDGSKKESSSYKERLNKWRRKDGDKSPKNKTRYFYNNFSEMKTESLLINKQPKIDSLKKEFETTKIIDMTGPTKRVLSGYHALKHTKTNDDNLYDEKQYAVRNNFSLPELMHNLNLIVEMYEQNIIANDKIVMDSSDKLVTMEHAHKALQDVVSIEQTYISSLEKVFEIVQNLKREDIGMNELAEQLVILQSNHATEYEEYQLWDLAHLVVAPKLKTFMNGWNPLHFPKQHIQLIEQWKDILYDGKKQSGIESFGKLVWFSVCPHLQSALEQWNPKQPNDAIQFLAIWDPLFTNWVRNNIYDQLLLPKITEEVIKWDPTTDIVPIHIWVHPWAPILGKRLEVMVYPNIRDKLGYALGSWHPSDRSARAVLIPWKDVFDMGEFMAFLLKYIVPKLQATLAELVITRTQQNLELWNQVWEWKDLLSVPLMAQLLEKYFFPKWLQMLTMWLNESPDYHQVSNWYSYWKSLLNEDMLTQINIKEYFRKALEMMHRAIGGGMPETTYKERAPSPKTLPAFSADKMGIASLGFREIVAQRCSEHGILFMPMMGRRYEGKQLYKVGNIFCYIDRSVLMVCLDGVTYKPMGLAEMMERAA